MASPTPLTEPVPERQSFDCPRCQAAVVEPWYGPCQHCRAELRATQGTEARDVEIADYVPKMNVTPNAVATKD